MKQRAANLTDEEAEKIKKMMESALDEEEIKLAEYKIRQLYPMWKIPLATIFPILFCCKKVREKMHSLRHKHKHRHKLKSNKVAPNQEIELTEKVKESIASILKSF